MGDAAVVSGRCQYSAFVSGLWKFDYHVFGVGLSGSSYVEFFALLGYLHSHIYAYIVCFHIWKVSAVISSLFWAPFSVLRGRACCEGVCALDGPVGPSD